MLRFPKQNLSSIYTLSQVYCYRPGDKRLRRNEAAAFLFIGLVIKYGWVGWVRDDDIFKPAITFVTKKGSQQMMKTPITVPSVLAAFVSLENLWLILLRKILLPSGYWKEKSNITWHGINTKVCHWCDSFIQLKCWVEGCLKFLWDENEELI